MEDVEDLHRSFDDLAENRFLLGTPAEVCEGIETYRETLEPSHVVRRVQWPGLCYERARECIELIGDGVITQFWSGYHGIVMDTSAPPVRTSTDEGCYAPQRRQFVPLSTVTSPISTRWFPSGPVTAIPTS
jgi:hypothetical protein